MPSAPVSRRSLPAASLAALALLALHVAFIVHFSPRGFSSMPTPLLTSGFAVEAYRAEGSLASYSATGRLAAYDPRVLAGQAAGIWEPLGTKALALGTVAVARLGVPPASAFDALAVLMHALVPLVGYAAARVSGASRFAAAAVLALWSALTFLDGLTHFAWFSGRIPWVLASAMGVLETSLAGWALSERRSVRGAVGAGIGVLVSSVLALLLHPVAASFVALVVVFVSVVRARETSPGRRAAVAMCAVAPLLWVAVALAQAGFVSSEPIARAFRVGPASLFWDLIEVPGPGYGAAGSSRTLLRTLCIGGGVLALVRRRGSADGRTEPLFWIAGASLVLAYSGSLLSDAWPIDPYFFSIPAAFAASIPAIETAFAVDWADVVKRGPVVARVGLLLALAVSIPRMARTALTYAPELLPERRVRGPSDFAVSALSGVNEPFPDPLGYDPPPAGLGPLAEFLVSHGAGRGRVLTDDAVVAAFLALRTSLPVLGPLGERGATATSADPTTLLEHGVEASSVAKFVSRYGVAFVVLGGPPSALDVEAPFLEPAVFIQGYRVRRVAGDPSLVARGVAHVDGTSLGSIRVSGAAGARVTLRYHYDAELACRPGCAIEREPVPGDEAGFISVPNPPAAFELYTP
jgi:hypothetical protein